MDIRKVLGNNQDKEFVKRILNPEKYPVLKNPDGSESTHSMAWGQVGNRFIVFPTVFQEGKKMKRYKPDDAFKRALDSGEAIFFDTPEEAADFSKNYKTIWTE